MGAMMKLSVEDEFILEFTKVYFGSGDHMLNDSFARCDVGRLAEKLVQQGLPAFFFNAVHSGKVNIELPATVLKKWQALSARIALRNTFYEDRGSKLLSGLQEQGVNFIMLKGFAHMVSLYGNTWTRPVSDLDILINRDDYPRLKELLSGMGFSYHAGDNFRGTVAESQEIDEAYYNEAHFRQDTGEMSINLDVHWGVEGMGEGSPLKSLFPIEDYPWRNYTESQVFGSTKVVCLTAEMQFIHNIMHLGLHHRLQGFKWFMDICLLLTEQGHELDWDFIRETVKEPDCRKLVGIMLRLVEDVTAGPTGIPHWREFWSGGGLPGEYGHYKSRLFAGGGRAGDYVTLVLLPVRLRDKLKVISFFLFKKEAVRHWRADGQKGTLSFFQPFYIVCRVAGEILGKPARGKKADR